MSESDFNEAFTGVEVAIIGMAGRFPGAENIDTFWQNIAEAVESVRTFTDEELAKLGVPQAMIDDPAYVKSKIDFDGAELFDAEFFGFSPREALTIDPQQRIFMETVWHAIENAGYAKNIDKVLVGTYVGCGANTYLNQNLIPAQEDTSDVAELLGLMNGNDKDSLSARVAYQFNLRGPAISVQTACSTSLVAVHQACSGLLNQEVDMAIAGGVWLNLLQKGGYLYQDGAILSADGHCRAFDEEASGTLIGSGAGVVILKRLQDALHDGDNIHAVIKGSAVNNDGADKVGFSAPSITGQTQVILAAQALAEVDADSIDYVEAHGTGTVLGDPIEVCALTQAFRETTDRLGYCALGSVKTNIGHLDAAAGVVGLIKTVQAMKHGIIPPSLNYEQTNPQIHFASSPFFVNTKAKPWRAKSTPRRAGVSSFGMGGTNAHMILEQAPVRAGKSTGKPKALLLSARSTGALNKAISDLADYIETKTPAIDDLAYTLAYGRQSFAHRAAILLDEQGDAAGALRSQDALLCMKGQVTDEDPSVAFLFPGQGAQHAFMGTDLYQHEPVFKQVVDECCEKLVVYMGEDLRTWLWTGQDAPSNENTDEEIVAERLRQTQYTQVVLFVVEYALSQWWLSQGLKPRAMLGHSIGEYVAACLSGVFSLDDALKLVVLRGKLLSQTEPGAMLTVAVSEQDVAPYLQQGLDLAAVNAEQSCVLAGLEEQVQAVQVKLTEQGIDARRLQVSRAFHSRLVEPVLPEFEQVLATITMNPPSTPFVSNVSGTWITQEEATSAKYWVQHMRGTVRFADGLISLAQGVCDIYIEVGPGETLATLAKRHASTSKKIVLTSQAHPQRLTQNPQQPLRCLAQLWAMGYNLNDEILVPESCGQRIELPVYPFERQAYWVNPKPRKASVAEKLQVSEEFLDIDDWFNVPVWSRTEALATKTGPTIEQSKECVLVFSNGTALVDSFIALLKVPVVVVEALPEQTQGLVSISSTQYQAPLANAEVMMQLLEKVGQDHGVISHLVHFWSLGLAEGAALEQVNEAGFYSLITLAQAVGEQRKALAKNISLLVVTDGLDDVTGAESLNAAKATLGAPCRVIAQEYPGVRTILADVLNVETNGYVATQLIAELFTPSESPAHRVALRGCHRFVPEYKRVQRPATDKPPVCIRQQGTYVITGGLGGVGLTLAQYLAEKSQGRLVLLGRSEIPEASTWSSIAADEKQPEKLRDTVQRLLALRASGAEVVTIQADVANGEQLSVVITDLAAKFGSIDGVVHAAGVAGGGLMAYKSREDSKEVMAAKVSGTRNILAACQPYAPEFILLCSSTTAIVGGMGSLDYCAANAYMDAISREYMRNSDQWVVSVNWDSWREVGMAAFLELPEGYGITPEKGSEAFERILSGIGEPNIILSTVPFERQLAMDNNSNIADHLGDDRGTLSAAVARPQLQTPYAEPEDNLQAELAQLVSEFLGVTPIGINDNLFELGADSLMAVQLITQLKKRYSVELNPAEFLKQPTVAALAETIEWLLIEEIENAEM